MTVNNAAPFVFGGFQGGGGPCNGEPDQTDGADLNNNGCFYGGGMNSATFFSQQANGFVPIPERWTEAETNWNQIVFRVTTVFDGDSATPGPNTTAADTIDAVNEALSLTNAYIMIETHDFTGDDMLPVGAYNQATPVPGGADSWASAVVFWDTVITAFKNVGRVWFNFSNEPTTGLNASAAWASQAEWWTARTRAFHNATNIVVMDLDDFGQDLGGLAAGSYDAWWASMASHAAGDLTDNLVLGWHAYGSRSQSAYNYASMDADLLTVHQKGYPILVGEYGQTAAIGTGSAGPDQWNRNAVEYLATTIHGPALATKYQLIMCVWHFNGDGGFFHSYKLTQGDDPSNPDGVLNPGVNGWSIPAWDITAAEANDPAIMEPLGTYHWNFSHL